MGADQTHGKQPHEQVFVSRACPAYQEDGRQAHDCRDARSTSRKFFLPHIQANAGAIVILCVGGLWVDATVSGPHFEGYALVLGSALFIQGILTIPVLWRVRAQ
jgi:hypothetical protein